MYILDDLFVVLVETKTDVIIQTLYRITPVNDHSFIDHVTDTLSELNNACFHILEFDSDEKLNEDLTEVEVADIIEETSIYNSLKEEEWNPDLLEPYNKYYICFSFGFIERLSKSERNYFYDLGLCLTKHGLEITLKDLNKKVIFFNLNKFGESHTWSRKEGHKKISHKILKQAQMIIDKRNKKGDKICQNKKYRNSK